MPQSTDDTRKVFYTEDEDGSKSIICAIEDGTYGGDLHPYYCYSLKRGALGSIAKVQDQDVVQQIQVDIQGYPPDNMPDRQKCTVVTRPLQITSQINWHTKQPLGFTLLSPDAVSAVISPGMVYVGSGMRYVVYVRGKTRETRPKLRQGAWYWQMPDQVYWPQTVRAQKPLVRGDESIVAQENGLVDIIEQVVGAAPGNTFDAPVSSSDPVQPLILFDSNQITAIISINQDKQPKSNRTFQVQVRHTSFFPDENGEYAQVGLYEMKVQLYKDSDNWLKAKFTAAKYTGPDGQVYQGVADAESYQIVQLPEGIPTQPQAMIKLWQTATRPDTVEQAVQGYLYFVGGRRWYSGTTALLQDRPYPGDVSIPWGEFESIWITVCVQIGVRVVNSIPEPILNTVHFELTGQEGENRHLWAPTYTEI